MAINVDTVYKTVLLILNKEQRGLVTPDEFNKTATQVQLDIFEQYFDDLNQQLRVPQSDYDYSDRQMSIDEKISPFKTEGNCIYNENTEELFYDGVKNRSNYKLISDGMKFVQENHTYINRVNALLSIL